MGTVITRPTSYSTPDAQGKLTFSYDSTHPYEVAIRFSADITWVVARDLLDAGLRASYGNAAGSGDVLAWSGPLWYFLLLNNGKLSQTVRVVAAQVRKFYADTVRLVPAGAGDGHYDAELDTDLMLLGIEESR